MGRQEPPPADFDVVIATRDRPNQLAACLRTLERQTQPGFRVVVVDDGSREPATGSLSGPSGADLVVLRNDSSIGPAASRNRILDAPGAPHILFLDDDVLAHPELIERHRAVLADSPEPVVSIGALLAPPDARLPVWDLWQADRLAREHQRLAKGQAAPSWAHVYTGNVALRRADFDAVGGFDPSLARQEDMELGYRLSRHGCRMAFENRAVAWHDAHHSLQAWLRIPAAGARYDVEIDRRQPGSRRLAAVRGQLADRHWLLRAARRVCARPRAGQAIESAAIAAGRALHRVRADRLALPAFSLVWDIEYNRSLAAATAGAAPVSPSPSAAPGTPPP